jgi:hypothetical protein
MTDEIRDIAKAEPNADQAAETEKTGSPDILEPEVLAKNI